MQTNRILSADLLDIIFDNRNKDYGAYELRRTYQRRITKAMTITGGITLLIFGSMLARSPKHDSRNVIIHSTVEISAVKDKEPEIPKPPKRIEPIQTRTQTFTPPAIVETVERPTPTIEDLNKAQIDVVTHEGSDYTGVVGPSNIDNGKDVIESKKNVVDEPVTIVQVEAKFIGNWQKFLEKNLNPELPVNNGAPAGSYRIELQFVVDTSGNVSDITPLTNLGYGMEQEAIRVLKRATKWEPAIQNGYKVKAYRRQAITFQVMDENQ